MTGKMMSTLNTRVEGSNGEVEKWDLDN
jgi:hypothetical protein